MKRLLLQIHVTPSTQITFDVSLKEVQGEMKEQNVQPPEEKRKRMTVAEKVMTTMMQAFVESQQESGEHCPN